MKTFVEFSLIVILTVTGFIAKGQEFENANYRFSSVTKNSGEILKLKNITLHGDSIIYYKTNASTGLNDHIYINLNDIKEIKVSSRTNILPGFLIGTGAGLAGMFITKEIIEKPKSKTSVVSGPGYTTTTTVTSTKTMAPGPKIAILAGGSLLGTIIGTSIKKGWKSIYQNNHTTMGKIGIDFNPEIISINEGFINTDFCVSIRF